MPNLRAQTVSVRVDDLELIQAAARTLRAGGWSGPLCPSCKQYTLVQGYVCFGCHYDSTAPDSSAKEES